MSTQTVVEIDVNGEVVRFCSEECAEEYKKKLSE